MQRIYTKYTRDAKNLKSTDKGGVIRCISIFDRGLICILANRFHKKKIERFRYFTKVLLMCLCSCSTNHAVCY